MADQKVANRLLIPNSAQIPNIMIDKFMYRLSGGEFKCLMYIARRTFGFQKEFDMISLSQFETGIVNRDEVRLDGGTGLSRPIIIKSLKNLVESGLVIKQKKGGSYRYKIDLECELQEVVKKLNWLNNLTSTSKETLPQLVKKLNTQNPVQNPGNPVGGLKNLTSNLPDWLNKEIWEHWLDYRKEIRKKMTPTTIKLQLSFLAKHKKDHVEIITRAMTNGWTGLHIDEKKSAIQNSGANRNTGERDYKKQRDRDNEAMRKLDEQMKELTDKKSIHG